MADQTSGLSFQETGLAQALAERRLTVPLNQRAYAWTQDDIDTLLNDLYRAFTAGESIYFLGAVVLTRDAAGSWMVADGQQRLATVSVIVAAVRDYLLELGDQKGAQKYQSTYLLDYDVRSKAALPNLVLNFEDREYFEETVLKPPSERRAYAGRAFHSHALLRIATERAHEHVRRIVAANPDAEKPGRLYDWVDFLHNSAKVILIMVPGRVGNAFKMFETLNGRGVPASQADILKNFLFEQAGEKKMPDVHTRWISMLSTIEDLGMDDLLLKYIRHFWISENGPTTEAELGEKLEAKVKSERQAVDLVMALEVSAVDYVALLTPRQHARWVEFGKDARDCIYTVTRELGAVQIRPLMLALAKHFPPTEAAKAFEMCLSWTVRFLIAGTGGGGFLDRHYGLRAYEISQKEITTAKKLAQRMLEVVPSDEAFKRQFSVATIRQGPLARYYLRALDNYMKDSKERKPQVVPSEDTLVVNLEHVLPVTPSAVWNIAPEVAAAYYKRLGNMALLGSSDNVKIANKSFAEKKAIYVDSVFDLTAEIAAVDTWDVSAIERHQTRMAELAPKVWPI